MAQRVPFRAFGLGIVLGITIGGAIAQAAPPTSITLDGSLGAPGAITATTPHLFTIPASAGKTVGANLFQSFGTFNVGTGDVASFAANAGTQNIIARVTGGSASSIDGILASPVNLFFLNPAGVMFTANAQVDVTGSFVVSTANYAKLSDGNIFYADTAHSVADAGLTAAPVSAFGFLSTPQPISFLGPTIGSQPNGSQPAATVTGIQVIGGDIAVNGANLFAPGGVLTLFSAAGTGEVPFNLAPTLTAYNNPGVTQFGNINITNSSRVEIDNLTGGGGIAVIRGGKITVDKSDITSGNFGPVVGGNMEITADQLTLSSDGFIGTACFGNADAGSITVNVAHALSITGTGSQISSVTETSGNSGDVSVMADSIDLNNGDIFSNADIHSTGQAGTMTVTAGSMTMEGNSRLSSFSAGTGNSGVINLTLRQSLLMTDTAEIVGDTYGSGNGGDITISAPQISITGNAAISASDFGTAASGGTINIVGNNSLSIIGNGTEVPLTFGILAGTFVSGMGGQINIDSAMLTLDGTAEISTVSASINNGGKAGDINIQSSQIKLSGGSTITARGAISDAGSIHITATDSLILTGGSSITTAAAYTGGGLTIVVGHLVYLLDSSIEAYAGDPTNPVGTPFASAVALPSTIHGGNINIDPDFVVLNNSLISANDLAGFGHDGNIINTADFFFTSSSLLHATGTIETTSPDLDLASSLAFLPANLESAATQLREKCDRAANHEFSTFIVVGRGGIENAPEELQPDYGSSLHLGAPGAGEATVR